MQSFFTILKCLIGLFFMITVIYAVIKIKRRFINSFDERYGGGKSRESRRDRRSRPTHYGRDDCRSGQGGYSGRGYNRQRSMGRNQRGYSRNRNNFRGNDYDDFQDW